VSATAEMVAIRDLDFRYREGEFRLRIPQLRVPAGETVAVIGPSGTGKTTLLNLIAGIVSPLGGQISVNAMQIAGLSETARRDYRIRNLGLVFQEFELLSYLNVLDNILLPFRINSALELTQDVKQRAVRLANEVGIADKLRRNVERLSQGERQRVAVCRALLTEPLLILADEPTGNLDPRNKGRVLDILFDYIEVHGTTLVTVTHDHDLLERFERVIEFSAFHSETGAGEFPGEKDETKSGEGDAP
jgi:ABC-type lipoprotein export system ATPase subunit